MDHGTPWWNMKAVAGWTWLTVWLMRQGIRLHLSGYRHPQTQGKVERFHGALGAAMQRRGMPARWQRQSWLDEFRWEYNHVRPHEALQMRTPAAVWSKSPRCYQAQPAAWEYEAGAEVRRVAAEGQLARSRSALGHQQSFGGRMGAADSRARTHPGVLLPQPGARARPRQPAVHRGGPLADELNQKCKGCPDNNV